MLLLNVNIKKMSQIYGSRQGRWDSNPGNYKGIIRRYFPDKYLSYERLTS